jgi:predicted kinase
MEAVIFCGIQGTGKSSFYRERFFNTHLRLSLDMLRTRHREDLLFRACLAAKQPVVIDNTNPTVAERAKYITAAIEARFRVVGYYFESKLADAMRRNAARPEPHRVPDRGVLGTYARLAVPTRQEGFDELFFVRLVDRDGGGFSVEAWRDDV